MGAEDRTSGSSRIDMIVDLLRESRDEIRDMADRMTKLEVEVAAARAEALAAAAAVATSSARPSLARDAGVATSASTIVVAVVMTLQALGVIKAPSNTPAPAPSTVQAP